MIKDTLYYKNAYLDNFETTVKECIEENGKIKVVLEETAFYPEGGGQPSDIGIINNIKVLKVEEKAGKIYHYVEKEIPVNKEVKCKIDFDKRFLNMQNHTAEHIVSGLICRKFNSTNVGFHIGSDFVTIDFNVTLSNEELKEIELQANEAIYQNIEIKTNLYTNEEASNMNYRSKIDLKEDVRLIEIPGYDVCACCGIHVARTGEIGIIKLVKIEKYKSGVRIYMLAGSKALEDYDNKYEQVSKISSLLSLKLDEVYTGVKALSKEIEELKKEKNSLKEIIFEQEISNLDKQENIIIEKENLDMKDMKNYCEKLKTKSEKISVVVSNGRFIMMSDTEDLKLILEDLKTKLDLQGGGNSQMVQGMIKCETKKIIELI